MMLSNNLRQVYFQNIDFYFLLIICVINQRYHLQNNTIRTNNNIHIHINNEIMNGAKS